MARYILLLLFVLMVFAPSLGLDLSLAPGLSVKNAILYLMVLILGIENALTRNRKLELLPVLVPLSMLVLYASLTWLVIVIAFDRPYYRPLASLIALKGGLADHLLLFLVFFYGVTRIDDASWLMKAVVWVILASSVITVLDTWNIPDLGLVQERFDGRAMGFFGGPNESATVLAFYFPALLALYGSEAGVKRLLGMVGVIAGLLCLMLFASRGAFVSIFLGSVVAVWYLRRNIPVTTLTKGALLVVALIAVSSAVFFATGFGNMLLDRLLTGVGSGSATDLSSGRTEIWGTALGEMADAPITFLTGFGWNSYYQSAGTRFATHNAYIDYLYDLGLIGLTLLVTTFVNGIVVARRRLLVMAPQHSIFVIALAWGMIFFMIGILFCDVQLAGLYVWPFIGAAMRVAIAGEIPRVAAVLPNAGQARFVA